MHYVGKPNFPNEPLFLERVQEILTKKQFTNNGPFVQKFEKAILANSKGSEVYTPHCIATSNATAALEILFSMLPKGEVIMPTFTFIATACSAKRMGHTPVFVDVSSDYMMDCSNIEQYITSKTVAVVVPQLFGMVMSRTIYEELVMKLDVPVILDSAHAVGINHDFWSWEVYSFHATKMINSFEGGAIIIPAMEDKIAKKARELVNFGFSSEYRGMEGDIKSTFGTNAKMSEIHAAAGLTNIESYFQIWNHNKNIWLEYLMKLPNDPRIKLIRPGPRTNYAYVVVQTAQRDKLQSYLWSKGIFARAYFKHCLHNVFGEYQYLPVAERLARDTLCLPTGLSVSKKDVGFICKTIKEAFKECSSYTSVAAAISETDT